MTFTATLPAASLSAIMGRLGMVATKSTIPILTHVWMRFEGGRLVVSGTNLDQALTLTAEATGDGATTAPAKPLQTIAARLDQKADLTMTEVDGGLRITQGRTSYRLPTLPAADFPKEIVLTKGGVTWEVPSAALAADIKALQDAASDDDVRYYLNGIHIDLATRGDPVMAATDGHVLGLARLGDLRPPEGNGYILPPAMLRPLMDLAKTASTITLTLTDTAIEAATETDRLRSKLVDGTFPDIRRLIPADTANRVAVRIDDLRSAIDRTGIIETTEVSGKRTITTRPIRINLTETEIILSAKNGEGEEATTICPCERLAGKDVTVGVSATLLAWAVSSLAYVSPDGRIEIGISDPASPFILSPMAESETAYAARPNLRVVMPMRIGHRP